MIRKWWTPLLLFAALCPRAASAQIASGGGSTLFRSDAAGVRTEPQYQAKPLMLGPLAATLSMTAQSVADSNIFRTAQSRSDDVYLEISPSIRVLASIGSHSATIVAQGNAKRYARFVSENKTTYDLSYSGRIDLGASSFATWRTGYAREVEPRGVAGSNLVSAGPAELQLIQSTWAGKTEVGRFAISAAAGVVQRSYKTLTTNSGSRLDQSFRDTRSVRVAPRLSFGVATSAAFFVGGSANRTTSLNRRLGAVRDAHGYTLLAGFRTETNGLVIGEIGIGWRGQNYLNPMFRDFNGFTYDATVDWYPTRFVSVRVQAGQDVVNSGLTTVAGIVRQSVAVNAYYDPLRNLRLNVSLDRDHDEFREIKFSTNTMTATVAGRYQIGRHLDVSAFARIRSKDTSNSNLAGGYDSIATGVALTGTI